jgi:hypothetical protein
MYTIIEIQNLNNLINVFDMARNLSGFKNMSKSLLRVEVSEGIGSDGGTVATRDENKTPGTRITSGGNGCGTYVDCSRSAVAAGANSAFVFSCGEGLFVFSGEPIVASPDALAIARSKVAVLPFQHERIGVSSCKKPSGQQRMSVF